MSPNEETVKTPTAGRQSFTTTHWSVVLAAGQSESQAAREALEKLCRAYWYPLYAYVRRQGHSPPDAQDLTQAFFARFLEKNYLAQVHPAKGKFRSFLLVALKHFLADEWDKLRTAKRGGGQVPISLDEPSPEERYRLEPADEMSAEKIFERRWALTVLEQARTRSREEYVSRGKGELYDGLKIFEGGEQTSPTYAELGMQLGMTESAVKAAAHRLRQRYHELVREEIAQTVAKPAEIDEEIRYLIGVISG
jgi:RNA polymerase sigma-70 factor (ECF subfamily)